MPQNFTKKEIALMRRLDTPAKVQDFLNSLPINFEKDGVDTLKSPLKVLRENNAHCIEGAILGAHILSMHGHRPLVMNLRSSKKDFDHVIAVFKEDGYYGALSKTNHAVLRYREPIYKNIRELAMSYFHEYFTDAGIKTLRAYSRPLDLNVFEEDWPMAEEYLWGIDQELDKVKYYDIAPKKKIRTFRKADMVERKAGKITEWKR